MTEHGEERDELRELWGTEQPPPEVDVDEVQRKARRFERTILFRNLREWAACGLLVPMSLGLILERPNPLLEAWGVGTLLGVTYVARRLWVQGRLKQLPSPAASTASYVQAYAAQLRQQSKLLSEVPRWYLAPLMLPAVAFTFAVMVRVGAEGGQLWRGWATLGVLAATSGLVAFINSRTSRTLREQADALEAG